MEEKHVVIIPHRLAWLFFAIPFGLIAIGVLLSVLFNENFGDTKAGILASCILFGLSILIITMPYILHTKDIFTPDGITRKRGKKIIREIKWNDVHSINYSKFGLLSLFSLCPWLCCIILDADQNNKKPLKEKLFDTSFSYKEFKKIQAIIPIKIELR